MTRCSPPIWSTSGMAGGLPSTVTAGVKLSLLSSRATSSLSGPFLPTKAPSIDPHDTDGRLRLFQTARRRSGVISRLSLILGKRIILAEHASNAAGQTVDDPVCLLLPPMARSASARAGSLTGFSCQRAVSTEEPTFSIVCSVMSDRPICGLLAFSGRSPRTAGRHRRSAQS